MQTRLLKGISIRWLASNAYHLDGVKRGYWESAVHLWLALDQD
jgi:hypothetical protein